MKDPDFYHQVDGIWVMNPIIKSIINDIFRKLDLVLSRTLDVNELRQFGEIVDLDYFKTITNDDFKNGKLSAFACTEDAITAYGFQEVLMDSEEVTMDDFLQILQKMGYDEDFYSVKS